MNEPMVKTLFPSGLGGRKILAMFSIALFFGIALFASRSSVLPAPTGDPKDKKVEAPTARAAAAANKFLAALDVKQQKKALYEFGSAKKTSCFTAGTQITSAGTPTFSRASRRTAGSWLRTRTWILRS